jgi:DNA mismatch endonuclease (patch repair protein)
MDKLDTKRRSQLMACVRNKNTGPEIEVRSRLFQAGLRFRLHRRDLPGSPDIVLPKYKTAVFVHGCFWHGHDCPRGKRPASNEAKWNEKIEGNIQRDAAATAKLSEMGWQVEVVWACRIPQDTDHIIRRLKN